MDSPRANSRNDGALGSCTRCQRVIGDAPGSRYEDVLSGFQELFAHLSTDAVRLRFFGPKKALTHPFSARMTQIDYDREITRATRTAPPATFPIVTNTRFFTRSAKECGGTSVETACR